MPLDTTELVELISSFYAGNTESTAQAKARTRELLVNQKDYDSIADYWEKKGRKMDPNHKWT